MGNQLQVPSVSKLKDYDIFIELKNISIEKVRECLFLWKTEYQNASVVSHKEFDEIFGHLIKDSDAHFDIFKHDNVLTVAEYLVVTILLSKTKSNVIREKVEYIASMFCETLEEVTRDDFSDMIRMCVSGFSRLFDIYCPLISEIENLLEARGMRYTREETSVITAVEENPDEFSAETGDNTHNKLQNEVTIVRNGIQFDKIWDFIQDNRLIALYLDAIVGLSTRANHDLFLKAQNMEEECKAESHLDPLVAPVTDHPVVAPRDNRMASMIAIKDIEMAQQQYTIKKNDDDDCLLAAMKKRSAPLWDLLVMDVLFMDAHDYDITLHSKQNHHHKAPNGDFRKVVHKTGYDALLPEVSADDFVFSVVEHFVLGERLALGVFENAEPNDSAGGLNTAIPSGKQPPTSFGSPIGGMQMGLGMLNSPATPGGFPAPSRAGSFAMPENLSPLQSIKEGIAPGVERKVSIGSPKGRMSIKGSFCSPPLSVVTENSSKDLMTSDKSSTNGNANFLFVVDIVDILGWFAENIPENVSNPLSIKSMVEAVEAAAAEAASEANSGAFADSAQKVVVPLRKRVSHAVQHKAIITPRMGSVGRARRVSSNAQHGALKVFQECGSRIALSPIKWIVDKQLCTFNKPCPTYTYKNIIQSSNSVYDIFLAFAKGYRSVAIATIAAEPFRVTHIVHGVQLAHFIQLHPQLLGKLYRCSIKNSRLMKRAITIKSSWNLGASIQMLAKYKVDCAVIIDDETHKACGRFSASVCQDIFWHWRQQQSLRSGKMLSLPEHREAYDTTAIRYDGSCKYPNVGKCLEALSGDLMAIGGGRGNNSGSFACFSSLAHPLKSCDTLGISMNTLQQYLDAVPPGARKNPSAFSEEDEYESSDSDSDSSSSSDSDSTSSSDRSVKSPVKSVAPASPGKKGAKVKPPTAAE